MTFEFWKSRLPVLGYIFGMWFFCFRIIGLDFSYLPGDLGDSRFIHFLLEHGYRWITFESSSFWNADFMYPFENNIAFSDNMLGTMPVYAFYRILHIGPETSFQLWWLTVCSLNYWAAYFVFKRWTNRSDLAIIGALIFAFSVFNIGQLNFLQMSVRFPIPMVFYAAQKLVETSKLKYFFAYALGVTLQFYSVMYLGLFLLYFSLGFLILYVVISKKYTFFLPLFSRKNVGWLLGSSLLCALALLWLTSPYREMANLAGVALYPEVVPFLPTISSFFFAHPASWSLGFNASNFLSKENYWLHQNYLGLLPTVTALGVPFLLIYRKIQKVPASSLLLSLTIAAFGIFLLFLRTEDGATLYKLAFQLPGMSSIRVLNRFLHFEVFLLTSISLLILIKLPSKYVWLLFALFIIDNGFNASTVTRTSKQKITESRSALMHQIKKSRKRQHQAFAVINSNQPAVYTHVEAMMCSAILDLPTVNGYSSSCPGGFGEFFVKASRNGLDTWLEHEKLNPEKVLILEINN